ncbi:MAG: NAD-dependent epimerase/dehydratase family protein, partial [Myxococcota bacterium]
MLRSRPSVLLRTRVTHIVTEPGPTPTGEGAIDPGRSRGYRDASRCGGALRYAIVGGTGMIGSWLANTLRARGDEVLVVTRRSPRSPDEVQWDPAKGVLSPRLLDGLTGVFDLAGAPLADRPWTKQRRKVLEDSRIRAAEVLVESLATLDRPPSVFVGVGGLGIFGDRGDA